MQYCYLSIRLCISFCTSIVDAEIIETPAKKVSLDDYQDMVVNHIIAYRISLGFGLRMYNWYHTIGIYHRPTLPAPTYLYLLSPSNAQLLSYCEVWYWHLARITYQYPFSLLLRWLFVEKWRWKMQNVRCSDEKGLWKHWVRAELRHGTSRILYLKVYSSNRNSPKIISI